MLSHAGAVAKTYAFAPGAVRWIGLAPAGLVVQVAGAKVEIHRGSATRTVQLKPNAIVLDYAEGRILYRVGQTFWLQVRSRPARTRCSLQGSRKHPIAADARHARSRLGAGHASSTGSAPSASRRSRFTARSPPMTRSTRARRYGSRHGADRIAAIPLFADLSPEDVEQAGRRSRPSSTSRPARSHVGRRVRPRAVRRRGGNRRRPHRRSGRPDRRRRATSSARSP